MTRTRSRAYVPVERAQAQQPMLDSRKRCVYIAEAPYLPSSTVLTRSNVQV